MKRCNLSRDATAMRPARSRSDRSPPCAPAPRPSLPLGRVAVRWRVDRDLSMLSPDTELMPIVRAFATPFPGGRRGRRNRPAAEPLLCRSPARVAPVSVGPRDRLWQLLQLVERVVSHSSTAGCGVRDRSTSDREANHRRERRRMVARSSRHSVRLRDRRRATFKASQASPAPNAAARRDDAVGESPAASSSRLRRVSCSSNAAPAAGARHRNLRTAARSTPLAAVPASARAARVAACTSPEICPCWPDFFSKAFELLDASQRNPDNDAASAGGAP